MRKPGTRWEDNFKLFSPITLSKQLKKDYKINNFIDDVFICHIELGGYIYYFLAEKSKVKKNIPNAVEVKPSDGLTDNWQPKQFDYYYYIKTDTLYWITCEEFQKYIIKESELHIKNSVLNKIYHKLSRQQRLSGTTQRTIIKYLDNFDKTIETYENTATD